MQRLVERDVGEVEPDDPVIRAHRLLGDGVEDAGREPLVASLAHGGVGDLVGAKAFRVFPRTARGEPHEHHLEAVPVRRAGTVAAERVLIGNEGDERLDSRPDRIEHFGVERAHDMGDLHSVVGR